jgi:guanosine-3',5'-bis(diphosphate) 3'-pyrophosphohydrolase
MHQFIEIEVEHLLEAIVFAEQKHRKQKRKDAEQSPYIRHPLAVMQMLWSVGKVREVEILIAAVLHDTIEDTDTTAEEVRQQFGEAITNIVLEVTDDKRLPRDERKQLQISTAPHKSRAAALVKIADKCCNLYDMLYFPPAGWSTERRQSYIRWAEQVVAGLLPENPALEAHFAQLLRQAYQEIG